jgi:hypothetical protein
MPRREAKQKLFGWTKHPVRCKNCYGRRTLNRHPDQYLRLPPCRNCHSKNGYWVDKLRMRDPDKSSGGKVCHLDCMAPIHGNAFIHRVNTKGCRQHEEHCLNRSINGTNGGLVDINDSDPGF